MVPRFVHYESDVQPILDRHCASCHTGRVRLDDGTMRLLHGNANTEMNVHLFIGRLTSVLKEQLSTDERPLLTRAEIERLVETTLEDVSAQRTVG